MRKYGVPVLCIALVSMIALGCGGTTRRSSRINWKAAFTGGKIHYGDNRIDRAIEQFELVIDENPNFAEVYIYLGDCYMAKKDYMKARTYFDKALEVDPAILDEEFGFRVDTSKDMSFQELLEHYWREFFNDGVDAAKGADFPRAEESFQNAALMDSTNIDTYTNLAIVQMNQNKWNEAIESLKRAIELNPGELSIRENLGFCYIQLKDYDNAIKEFEKILAIDPENVPALENISFAYEAKGDFEGAVPFYTKLLELKPDDKNKWYNLGVSYHNQENYSKAIEAFKKVDELSPEDRNGYYGKLGIDPDDSAQVEARREEIEEMIADDVEMLYILTQDLFKLEKYQEAEKYAKKIIDLQPDNPENHELLGQIYARNTNRKEIERQRLSMEEFQKAEDLRSKGTR
jgi:tetratricopeptide (TPR) repeat protein